MHMGILDKGCNCNYCLEITKQSLKKARDKWNNGERNIILEHYHYTCSDGCCDDYGVNIIVNGFELGCDGENVENVLNGILEFLEFGNVSINTIYKES